MEIAFEEIQWDLKAAKNQAVHTRVRRSEPQKVSAALKSVKSLNSIEFPMFHRMKIG